MKKRDNLIKWSIIGIFVSLYSLVSIISTIHVIDFFKLSNPTWLAITLAIAFELGAAASLAAIIILDKTSKTLVWILFGLITSIQIIGNMYYAYTHLANFQGWIDLFGLTDEEPIFQKRILSLVSGAILPVVALGFIKSLVDYLRPEEDKPVEKIDTVNDTVNVDDYFDNDDYEFPEPSDKLKEAKKVWEGVNRLREEGKLPEHTQEDIENEPSALAFTHYDTEEENKTEEDVIEITDEEKELVDDIKDMVENGIGSSEESKEKLKDVEKKIAKAISQNPQLKELLSEEIKKLDEDKYTKSEDSPIANVNNERRVFGGM